MEERNIILIAGGNEENRRLLGEPLSNAYDIIEAGDGKQVLAEIQRRKGELAAVLLDWDMPLVGAYQILQVMQSKGMTEHILAFVTTVERIRISTAKSTAWGRCPCCASPTERP